mmetsp:Transcript_113730/g.328416  ORF Transcript_113730/g.328416 Transcript_113730/m.328416 type:complete len:138 (+) Transcript_113730:138-551(+)
MDDMDLDDEGAGGETKSDTPQFTEAQTKSLLAELSPKLKEELCQVLRQQKTNSDNPDDRPSMSPELCRILQRFQRRCGIGPNGQRLPDQGEEIWPMYLGVALFIIISFLFIFLWIQEQYAEDDLSGEEDFYWLLKEW